MQFSVVKVDVFYVNCDLYYNKKKIKHFLKLAFHSHFMTPGFPPATGISDVPATRREMILVCTPYEVTQTAEGI